MAPKDRDRAVALSLQLAQAHQKLRSQLASLKAGRDLTVHCVAFCAAVTAHHEGEDAGMFAELLRLRPDLAGTVDKLVEDHGLIAWILSRIAAATSDDAVSGELDGLTAILESHFAYEERAISAALDAGTPDTGWSAKVFGFHDG
ncbi:hemerythrin domain-containing protein [Dactylosporangium cerinum]|uniref:Hemerythrin domain-containing protein n=1 Tax=Dactylosporangium cerinum TaxID=1434730 RepID=A0ABV9W6H7_9ACTN